MKATIGALMVGLALQAAVAQSWEAVQIDPLRYFSANYKISDNSYQPQFEPAICADGRGGVCVFWKDGNTPVSTGRYAMSANWGTSFRPSAYVFGPETYQTDPVAFASPVDHSIHLIWHAFNEGITVNKARHMKTTDLGETWELLPGAHNPAEQTDRSWGAIGDDGTVYASYLIWSVYNRTRFGWSYDDGLSWTWNPTRLVGISGVIATGAEPGEVYCCPADNNPGGNVTLRFYRSTDYGASFGSPTLTFAYKGVSWDGRWNYFPCIAANSSTGHVYVVWPDSVQQADGNRFGVVYFSRSTDGGQSFETPIVVNDDSYSADLPYTEIVAKTEPANTYSPKFHPWMAVDVHGRIHVAWQDARTGEFEIKYAVSIDGGLTFSDNMNVTDRRFTLSQTYYGEFLALAVDDRNVYVTWPDGREGNTEIYFAWAPIALFKPFPAGQ
jgi:hypothetical protein